MNETNSNWDDLRLFLAVARSGGLAGAAKTTGKSAPTLGRRMLALEKRLGKALFERRSHSYALTAEGQALLAKLGEVEAKLEPLIGAGEGRKQSVIRISAGAWMTQFLCGIALELLEGTSAQLQFISADHVLSIRHREAVIGIRNRRPDQPGLAARQIGTVQFAVYAKHADNACWVQVIGNTPSAQWVETAAQNDERIEVTHPRNALDLALCGAAKAVLPTFVGDRQKTLQRLTPAISDLTHDQWLVTHNEERFEPETRKVIDRIAAALTNLHK